MPSCAALGDRRSCEMGTRTSKGIRLVDRRKLGNTRATSSGAGDGILRRVIRMSPPAEPIRTKALVCQSYEGSPA